MLDGIGILYDPMMYMGFYSDSVEVSYLSSIKKKGMPEWFFRILVELKIQSQIHCDNSTIIDVIHIQYSGLLTQVKIDLYFFFPSKQEKKNNDSRYKEEKQGFNILCTLNAEDNSKIQLFLFFYVIAQSLRVN